MNQMLALLASAAGWAGAVATVTAYALVTQRRMEPDSMRFQALNAAGAALMGVSAFSSQAWPSATVNLIWLMIGVQALVSARHLLRAALSRRVQRLRTFSQRPHHSLVPGPLPGIRVTTRRPVVAAETVETRERVDVIDRFDVRETLEKLDTEAPRDLAVA